MPRFEMPNFYVKKFPNLPEFPLNWRDETSGILPTAVMAYLEDKASVEQIELVGNFIDYFIHAPVWDIQDNYFETELKDLRESSKKLTNRQEIHEWIHKAMEIGLDPL